MSQPGEAHARAGLAEIPSFDGGTWRLPADGPMETTYRLRDNLRWHDGTPVSVEDVAFSLRVYLDREVPVFTRVVSAVDRLEQRDERTFDVYWRQPYSFADRLTFRELTVLPRHLLAAAYEQDVSTFINSAYWGDSFVGSGPFRLLEWSRGSRMELGAFEQYFLGRPKVDRISVLFVPDENTLVAQVLAGELDLALQSLRATRAAVVAVQVKQSGVGEFVFSPSSYRHWTYQYANHASAAPLRDVRVRRALAYALDRQQLAEFATAGLSPAVDSWIPPDDPRFRDAEPFIVKYPHDPARALALFAEAGWARGSDGALRDARGQALQCDIRGAGEVGRSERNTGRPSASRPPRRRSPRISSGTRSGAPRFRASRRALARSGSPCTRTCTATT